MGVVSGDGCSLLSLRVCSRSELAHLHAGIAFAQQVPVPSITAGSNPINQPSTLELSRWNTQSRQSLLCTDLGRCRKAGFLEDVRDVVTWP